MKLKQAEVIKDIIVMDRLKTMSERLKREYNAQKVILYGSHARGEATEDSDIDVFIVAPTQERFFERMATVLRILRDLYHGVPISPIVLSPDELEERKNIGDQFINQILNEGIEL
jgi:predicted nucleotidyltransferase